MSLEIAGIGKNFLAVLTDVSPTLVVGYLVANEVGLPVENFRTLPAFILLLALVAVFRNVTIADVFRVTKNKKERILICVFSAEIT